jgi:hypothetical protein
MISTFLASVLVVAQDNMVVTTDMQMTFYYLLFAVSIILVGLGFFIRKPIHSVVMCMVGCLIFAYIGVTTIYPNNSFAIIAVIFAVIAGLGMIFNLYNYMNTKKTWVSD